MSIESPKSERHPETVQGSAIRFRGKVYTGLLHVHALDKLELEHPNWKQLQNSGELIEDGFITTEGRFIDRDVANILAYKKSIREFK